MVFCKPHVEDILLIGANNSARLKSQLLACYSGIIFMVFWTIGWFLIGRFIPPHDPGWSGAQVADFYQQHAVSSRVGLLISLWSAAFLMPFTAAISAQMARIEGKYPVWSYTVLGIGAANVLTFTFPVMFWAVAAFRSDRSADLVLLLNDLAWVPFVGMTSPFLLLPIAIAIVGFLDESEEPVFPRWACLYNIGSALLLVPGGLITFFQAGPFAWNGVMGFWLPVTDFFIWFFVMTFLLRKAVLRQALEESSIGFREEGV